jgi:hypothetical protein
LQSSSEHATLRYGEDGCQANSNRSNKARLATAQVGFARNNTKRIVKTRLRKNENAFTMNLIGEARNESLFSIVVHNLSGQWRRQREPRLWEFFPEKVAAAHCLPNCMIENGR